VYQASPKEGPLLQGEVIGPLWEHQPTAPPVELQEGEPLEYVSFRHARMVVMTQDCDLDQDFAVRFKTAEARKNYAPASTSVDLDAGSIPNVLLCDAFEEDEIRPLTPKGSDNWRRVKRNQNERYHHLDAAVII